VMNENEYISTIRVHCPALPHLSVLLFPETGLDLSAAEIVKLSPKGLMKASGSDWPNCGLLGHSAERAS